MLVLTACHEKEFQTLPDGVDAVNVNLGSGKWTATIRNEHGEASDTMFAANDRQRSNIYLTPTNQLVIIEQGGDDVFFAIPKDGPPKALSGRKYAERDTRSDNWRYVGVIKDEVLIPPTQAPECIALLGEGRSPYRKQYQVPNFCP